MIKAEYQEWKSGQLVHEYIVFDREKLIANGQKKVVERYDYVLSKFKKLSKEERKKGMIYGGVEYDFLLEEVD